MTWVPLISGECWCSEELKLLPSLPSKWKRNKLTEADSLHEDQMGILHGGALRKEYPLPSFQTGRFPRYELWLGSYGSFTWAPPTLPLPTEDFSPQHPWKMLCPVSLVICPNSATQFLQHFPNPMLHFACEISLWHLQPDSLRSLRGLVLLLPLPMSPLKYRFLILCFYHFFQSYHIHAKT